MSPRDSKKTVRRIVIACDDLGLAPSVDRAAAAGRSQGLITDADIMPTSTHFAASAAQWSASGARSIGWHATLSEPTQRPLTRPIATLCNDDGTFKGRDAAFKALAAPTSELAQWITGELGAQLEAVTSLGLLLVHASGHHHVHLFRCVRDALIALLKGKHCVIRGYGEGLPPRPQVAAAIRQHSAEARAAFLNAGHFVTRTTGFRWCEDPEPHVLAEDLAADLEAALESNEPNASNDAAPIELMLHLADAPGLSLKRDREWRSLAGAIQLVSASGHVTTSCSALLGNGSKG